MIKIECAALMKSNKNVVFIENHLPGLESGDYTMTVTQTTSGTSSDGKRAVDDQFQTTQQFSVLGERFMLKPNSIASSFPANHHQGDFSNCLPHVVLTMPTFPWQRDLGEQYQGSGIPWIGLLAFAQGEAPDPKQITLGTSRTSQLPAGTEQILFYPFTEEKGDDKNDPCRVIDLHADLFNQLAPSVEELKYLAHVREVDITNKATPSIHYAGNASPNNPDKDKASFAVVVGNRLLSMPGQYTVHLVSLENMGAYLPASTGQSNLPAGKTYVRLVSLHSWDFSVVAEKRHLSDIVRDLDKAPINLRLPNINSSEPDVDHLNEALAMGYVPMKHTLRSGGQTASWYRGPFTPYAVRDHLVDWPKQSADAWIQYNPDNAMFDVSYAAAWQLGRLLGLQNKAFAEALYQWKCQNIQATIHQLEQAIVADHLGLPPAANTLLEASAPMPMSQVALSGITQVWFCK